MSGLQDFATRQLIQDDETQRAAGIARSFTYKGFTVRKEVIDLTNGYGPDYGSNPYPIPYPFKGVFVRKATDSVTTCTLALNDDSQISVQNGFDLLNNDLFRLPRLVAKGAIVAAPQPGKSVTLWFIVEGDFQSGSLISNTAGGVSISTGSGMTPQPCKSVDNTAAVQLVAADTSRKKATFQNRGGGSIFLSGTSTVKNASAIVAGTTTVGIEVGPGQAFEWTSTGAAYAIGDAAVAYTVSIQTES